MKIDLWDFSELKGKFPESIKLTADNITDMSLLNQESGRIMTAEEAEDLFYQTNDCLSDDVDSEMARIERWCNEMDIQVTD